MFKAISGKFIYKILLPLKYDKINSCKIFYIKYKMRGTKHPWVHDKEFNFFLGGCTPPPPKRFFLITLEPLYGFAWNFVPMNKIPWEHFGIKAFGDTTFCTCVNMSFLTQGEIYRPEFHHENNGSPVSQDLDMQLSWKLP